MSVYEKKALAFQKLAAVKNEEGIDEISKHLDKLNNDKENGTYNLSQHIQFISQRYNETLNKLAK